MLENPIVSNSTRKSENLFGADNQQERLQYLKEVTMNESEFVEIVQVNSRGKEVRTKVKKDIAEKQNLHLADEPEPQILLFGGLLDVLYKKES